METSDFFEATTGFNGGGGGLFGEDEDNEDNRAMAAIQRKEKDAVLCLVDASLAMFSPIASSDGLGSDASSVKVEEPHASQGNRMAVDSASATITPFRQAMQMVSRIYQAKIISSDRDILGLVLYNTAQTSSRPSNVRGVYLIHHFNTLDAERVQEVEQLGNAGVPGSRSYEQFKREIGHGDPSAPAPLDDALWIAQLMLLQVRSAAVKYRRIFIFTNDDNPAKGNAQQLRRCVDKVRTMQDEGVIVEVFALGSGGSSGAPGRDDALESGAAPSPHSRTGASGASSSGGSAPGTLFSSVVLRGSDTAPFSSLQEQGDGLTVTTGTMSTADRDSGGHGVFRQGKFWDKLKSEAAKPPAWSIAASSDEGQLASASAVGRGYTGGVHILNASQDGGGDDDCLHVVLDKLHPQRPFRHTTLSIGLRSDGGAVPKMAVSIYVPVMPAAGPRAEKLEASTNSLVKGKTRFVRQGTPANTTAAGGQVREGEEETEAPGTATVTATAPVLVRRDQVRYGVAVADRVLPFTKEERARVREVAAGGAPVGFTILCFKPVEAVLLYKHSLQRSTFLHANLQQGGESSLRCFVQLVRTLRKQGKAAIALYLRAAKTAPSIVALVPSPPPDQGLDAVALQPVNHTAVVAGACATSLQYPARSLPVEGLGFYVVPLPYADDIRPLPAPEPSPQEARLKPAEDQVALAEKVIAALTVPYDITAVSNPSVQLQYHMLRKLALQNVAPRVNETVKPEEESAGPSSTRRLQLSREGFEDSSLPDYEGMSKYASLFREFNDRVLGHGYDADKLCPQPKAAVGRANAALVRGRENSTKVEGESEAAADGGGDIIDAVEAVAERGDWHRLTVAELRAYLKAMKATGGGGKRKDDLIAAAKSAHNAASRRKPKKEEEE